MKQLASFVKYIRWVRVTASSFFLTYSKVETGSGTWV